MFFLSLVGLREPQRPEVLASQHAPPPWSAHLFDRRHDTRVPMGDYGQRSIMRAQPERQPRLPPWAPEPPKKGKGRQPVATALLSPPKPRFVSRTPANRLSGRGLR